MKHRIINLAILGIACLIPLSTLFAESTSDLAKAAQNPISDLISIPFQNNINFDMGPLKKIQNVLNIQPVIPINIGSNWNVITRTIVPVISHPAFTSKQSRVNGIGDTVFSAFLSPSHPGKLIWGVGPVLFLPTITNDRLGSKLWGAGPTVVGLMNINQWVVGALLNNIWSFTSKAGSSKINMMTLQPFVNYNLSRGLYLTTSPIITANWQANSGQRWTVPIGGGVGKIFRIGKQSMNFQLQGYYNLKRPSLVGHWNMRVQLQFMFPK